jgi:hypothetical protein
MFRFLPVRLLSAWPGRQRIVSYLAFPAGEVVGVTRGGRHSSRVPDGGYVRANTAGSQVTIKFNGIRFDWIATIGTTLGKGDVYLDGALKGTINLAATAVAYQRNVWSTGFIVPGVHTVVIKWNTSNAAGKYTSLDRADVWGALQ